MQKNIFVVFVKWVLVINKIFIIDFDTEKSARCNRTRCKRDPVLKIRKNWFVSKTDERCVLLLKYCHSIRLVELVELGVTKTKTRHKCWKTLGKLASLSFFLKT